MWSHSTFGSSSFCERAGNWARQVWVWALGLHVCRQVTSLLSEPLVPHQGTGNCPACLSAPNKVARILSGRGSWEARASCHLLLLLCCYCLQPSYHVLSSHVSESHWLRNDQLLLLFSTKISSGFSALFLLQLLVLLIIEVICLPCRKQWKYR